MRRQDGFPVPVENTKGCGIRTLSYSGNIRLLLRDGLRRADACAGAAGDAFVGVDNIRAVAGRDCFGRTFSGARTAGDADIFIDFVSHFFSV